MFSKYIIALSVQVALVSTSRSAFEATLVIGNLAQDVQFGKRLGQLQLRLYTLILSHSVILRRGTSTVLCITTILCEFFGTRRIRDGKTGAVELSGVLSV